MKMVRASARRMIQNGENHFTGEESNISEKGIVFFFYNFVDTKQCECFLEFIQTMQMQMRVADSHYTGRKSCF